MNTQALDETIKQFLQPGKGILAADESTPTIKKRFDSINVESTEENRRNYRQLLFTTKGVAEFLNAVIVFEETLTQKANDGTPLPQILTDQGIIVCIKVDQGLADLNEIEKYTQGIETLSDRLEEYKKHSSRMAKWRAVYNISDNTPSEEAVTKNAEGLAEYAAICQEHGVVPIVEPEVLIDGDHTIEKSYEVTEHVLKRVYEELAKKNVYLPGTVLKPSMVISGKDGQNRAGRKEVAAQTLKVLHAIVPQEVPSINFLSGGQSSEEATEHLQEMNTQDPNAPWMLSFSYGRALQDQPLKTWAGKAENVQAAQDALYKRAKLNSLAVQGKYSPDME